MPKLANLEKELWFYEFIKSGEIKVERDGTITDKDGNKIGCKNKDKNGKQQYFTVTKRDPNNDNKCKLIMAHRLVYMAFHGPIKNNTLQINHKDGNKHNNHIDNLELVTQSENGKHAYKLGLSKPNLTNRSLTDDDVINVMYDYKLGILTKEEICNKYNIQIALLNRVIRGETYKHLTYRMEHFDIRDKLTDDNVKNILLSYHIDKLSVKEISEKYDTNLGTIYKILKGKIYKQDDYDPNIYNVRKQKLTDKQVIELINDFNSGNLTINELVIKYEISIRAIDKILTKMTYNHLNVYIDIEKYKLYKKNNRKKSISNKTQNSISSIESLIQQDIQKQQSQTEE